MKIGKNIFYIINKIILLLIFVTAILIIYRELNQYHYHDIIQSINKVSFVSVLSALILTILSYSALTGYDTLSVYYIKQPIGYWRIAFVAFISYAFGYNIGVPVLSSNAVRYRLYSAVKLSIKDITKIIIFNIITFWLGYFVLAGVIFLSKPIELPGNIFHSSFVSTRFIGLIFLLLTGSYLILVSIKKNPLLIKGIEFPMPSLPMVCAQILVSSIDLLLAGSVLYVLIPSSAGINFPFYLNIYLLAQIAGIISSIPGGLGIFETIMIMLLSPFVPASTLLGPLLAYRIIYYLFPLFLAAAMLIMHEISMIGNKLKQLTITFSKWISFLVPNILSTTTFISGVILLLSGSTPTVKTRLEILRYFLPLPAIEISHFLASLSGIGLVILARGLQKRLNASYYLTLFLLAGGVLFSLLKGFDYEEAAVLSLMFFLLFPCRKYFYRKTSLLNQQFTLGWIFAIFSVLISSAWIGFFSYKHVDYSNELWWQFELTGDAPRFLRAMTGITIFFLVFSVFKLLRSGPPKPHLPDKSEMDNIYSIVTGSASTTANLALLGDKSILFSDNKKSFLMYAVEGRSWISMGEPVGPNEEKRELIWKFRDLSNQYNGWPVFYEIGEENLPLYIDTGFLFFKIGEEGRVNLEKFSLEGASGKNFRHTLNKFEKEGCSFEIIPKEKVQNIISDIKVVSDLWLAEKHSREKGFSLGFFKPEYLVYFSQGVVKQNGKIIAFTNIWTGAEKKEVSIDLMRYRPESPDGVMEFLFLHLLLWGKSEGYNSFNLGMAPFSGIEAQNFSPVWNKFGDFLYRHGEHFYNFKGLRQYKEKFGPEWKPMYLAASRGLVLPQILANIASLISGRAGRVINK